MTAQQNNYIHRILFGLSFLLLLGGGLTYFIFEKEYVLIPLDNKKIISIYDDSASGGSSTISWNDKDSSSISFDYQLGNQYEYPYVGISIEKDNDSTFQLANFDAVEISIKAKNGEKIPFNLRAVHPQFTQLSNDDSFVPFQAEIALRKNQSKYILPLTNFAVPLWWMKEHHVDSIILLEPLKNQIKSINIEGCALINTGIPDHIKIDKIRFFNNDPFTFPLILSALVLMIVGYLAKRWNTQKKVEFVYTPTQKSENKEITANILQFVHDNYHQETLSITTLKNEFGTSEANLSEYFKKETGVSFKQHLNAIRLTESKRLLTETELSISEIAYQVGYSNVSHFNRVFKQHEGITPTQYRTENEGKP